ncbi:alpha/beta fold hydrolase [Pseudonocardia sp. KRD-184]|uniref:Alpha/beta fold hydrolase n=1 Tax=Pseudonocardia oceani TaxID=2792013 RepID=A0ABS6UGT3_9PSEU|nr:alpha/beta fold hydrolase [Pseudonocardia oceani]MBW0088765.1 alpha/beta fold hydrolase [Pseudonocardia oceani]MBW0099842.1 alpha/beta fold hydrolase [Pseudonocardia oceani]MBW0107335.1 alpha/beta fold hydrolase [Pseudonocardia oceani]MBW0122432.1 alpha/beta fold hydrolase [Pseudonocardia oceani]MBW0131467.1 alpha/beta fold hydrolase [Pseudonocardia oceani]
MVSETGFDSHGTRCSAWYLEAGTGALTGPRGRPCVVMAHGFGATKDAGLLPFAERFAAAGADVLVFDYRGYGTSGGSPRQNVFHVAHRQDYHAALAHARGLPGVDPDRIVLWGSSYSGGHVVPVAARDGQVAAVVSQGAAMDGLAALLEIGRYAGIGQLLRLTGHGLRDLVGSALGRGPHLIPVVGPPGSLAAITAEGAEDGYRSIMGPTFRNEMLARGALFIPLNRPVAAAAKLRAPIFLVVAADDNIAPPAAVRAVAAKAGAGSEILELPSGHFDIYSGEFFERSSAAQVAFLQRVLRVEAPAV